MWHGGQVKKIAIIGANNQQSPLIEKAKEKGLMTHVFAWQTLSDEGERAADFFYPISAGSKDEILEKCREIGIDAIATVGSDVSAVTAAYVASKLSLPYSSYAGVFSAANKITARDILGRCGVPQPNYCAVGDSIPDELKRLTFPLVVKPSDRSGGRGLSKVENEQQLFRALGAARDVSFEGRAIVEEFIDGTPYSCECISYAGKHTVLGYTRRYNRVIGGKICEYRHDAPANIPASVMKQAEELAPAILSALGLGNGASSVEFTVDKSGKIYVIEVTPTMYGDYIGTHLIPAATGYDYLGMVVDIALGKTPDLTRHKEGLRSSVRFIYSSADEYAECAPDAPSVADGRRYGHFITAEPYKEFGGCPPASFGRQSTGSQFDSYALALNSEYTALYCALCSIGCGKIAVPHYISGASLRVLSELGIEPVYYRIDENLVPTDIDESASAVLIVNHNRACCDYAARYAEGHKNVIIDNTYSFFTKPIISESIYNIYSVRRFFPTPDGAYLVSATLPDVDLKVGESRKRFNTLLKSLECGEGAAYKEYMADEQQLATERALMSPLTRAQLECFDLESARAARARNFGVLDKRLDSVNLYPKEIRANTASKFYPLLVNEDIRAKLVSRRIYVPLMWRRLLSDEHFGSTEHTLAEKMIYLPCDQWYSEDDMEYIADTVMALLS